MRVRKYFAWDAMRPSLSTVLVVAGLTLMLACPAIGVEKGNLNPGVLPHNSNAYGKSYGEWQAAWWQWALSIPTDVNPLVDETGQFAAEGQSGKVWFLGGVFNVSGRASRTVTVPTGRPLFFPILDYVWVNLPEFGDNRWSPQQEAYARGVVADIMDSATDLACEVNGRPLQNLGSYRGQSSVFEAVFPQNNIWGLDTSLFTSSTHIAVDDGVYVMLTPLSAGEHTIHFAGTATDSNFHLDVTYHITARGGASPVPEPATLALLGSGALGVLACVWRRRKR